ncbi:hypothetical protein SAMN05421837_111188 [Amycolatopsis pretoriensis]|uniref:Uncharacterized protein n=1 Tax=Amycolatopsis pretoriensis TaxID=218821 RepID=A0A1H5RGT9_9PSEU|nr:hypothetical protein [Amycolatopsis pretoriensis]SEF36767.1 hypothetical protein SAMN05421837_111188 [Amycolatopsis pretoriensis]
MRPLPTWAIPCCRESTRASARGCWRWGATWSGPRRGWTEPGSHWKTRRIVERAAGRPLAWVDDETTESDRIWVASHHPAPALVHTVAASTGLTGHDFETIGHWITSVA